MGNCLRHESEVQWGGEDWTPAMTAGSEKSASKLRDHNKKDEYYSSGKKIIKEVKVKITKKQLEQLLGKMDVDVQEQGCSAGHILGQLVKVSVQCETTHIKSWRPRLQSIPEL